MKERIEREIKSVLPEDVKFLAETYGIKPKNVMFLLESGVSLMILMR
jgi:hypothetical protein